MNSRFDVEDELKMIDMISHKKKGSIGNLSQYAAMQNSTYGKMDQKPEPLFGDGITSGDIIDLKTTISNLK